MGNLTDIFQVVACLPNLPEKEYKTNISKHATESLNIIDSIQPSARKEYLKRLACRAHHHKSIVDKIAKRLSAPAGTTKISTRNEQLIRDFYHGAYYAAFFVARFALVSTGGYDCTGHSTIDEAIRKRQSLLGQHASTLAQHLEEWREYRNVADYIMSDKKIVALASPQLISSIANNLQSHFATWNVK